MTWEDTLLLIEMSFTFKFVDDIYGYDQLNDHKNMYRSVWDLYNIVHAILLQSYLVYRKHWFHNVNIFMGRFFKE